MRFVFLQAEFGDEDIASGCFFLVHAISISLISKGCYLEAKKSGYWQELRLWVGSSPSSSFLFTCGQSRRHISSGRNLVLIILQIALGSFSRLASYAKNRE